jgi:hypothetical protein
MEFSENKKYLLAMEPMKIRNRSVHCFPVYELYYKEFCKCMYLARFMQDNKFPKPRKIVVPQGDLSCLYPAGAIKYAMGPQWGGCVINSEHDGFKSENDLFRYLSVIANVWKDCKGLLLHDTASSLQVLVWPNVLAHLKDRIGEYNTGDAVLLSGADFSDIYEKIEHRENVDGYVIKCDPSIIPNGNAGLRKAYDRFRYYLAVDESVKNQYCEGSDDDCDKFYFYKLAQTFQKQPYSVTEFGR